MRTNYSRIAAVVMAISAGGLAAFALRPAAGTGTLALAARNPAVEVRTQVIRRTIHVIRHEPGARLRGSRRSPALVVAARGRARTVASGASTHPVTRSSGGGHGHGEDGGDGGGRDD